MGSLLAHLLGIGDLEYPKYILEGLRQLGDLVTNPSATFLSAIHQLVRNEVTRWLKMPNHSLSLLARGLARVGLLVE